MSQAESAKSPHFHHEYMFFDMWEANKLRHNAAF
eukprot:gene2226-13150_t